MSYEVVTVTPRNGEPHFRITDTATDSRIATCYVRENAELVCRALNAYALLRPPLRPRKFRCPLCGQRIADGRPCACGAR